MISICIPIYNYNVAPLVESLSKQIDELSVPCELVLIDDASDISFRDVNRASCSCFHYIELPLNVGRSRIRNLFLEYARYDNLIFMDCDVVIESSLYIKNYLKCIEVGARVVCGGRIYDAHRPSSEYILRWKYGRLRESKPEAVRRQQANKSFMTNNFLIHRDILAAIRFDERITTYGHEDTLFGYALNQAGVQICHINNPVMNGDFESNSDYLVKVESGLINLVNILQFYQKDERLDEFFNVLKFYHKVKCFSIWVLCLYRLLRPLMKWSFGKGWVNLYVFDFYKLGFFMSHYRELK